MENQEKIFFRRVKTVKKIYFYNREEKGVDKRMKTKERFFVNGLLLSLTALLMRFIGLSFNVYLTEKIGSTGIGLITLINSVYGFAVTFATSGIRLTATRLCSEAMGKESECGIRSAMKKCLLYALSFGCTAGILLFLLAKPIGVYLLDDPRTVKCLYILSPALPFIALSSAMSGYFNAVRRVYKNATTTIFEQAVKIALTVKALEILLPKGIEYSCIAVVAGSAISESLSFLCSFILYRIDLKNHIGKKGTIPENQTKNLFAIALPVAFTAYFRSGLLTLEHMLIPIGLKKYGLESGAALSAYGTVQGMALPVVLFPIAVLSSFTGLLVPEIAQAMAKGDSGHVRRTANKVIAGTLFFSIGASAIIYTFSSDLGMTFYNSPESARYIKYFSLLIPVMYFDTAVDALLQGLGEQVYSMKVNIIDAGISALLVWCILPHTGIDGYVGIVFFCEILNTALSVAKLIRKVKLDMHFFEFILLPVFSVLGATNIVRLITAFTASLQTYSIFPLILKMFLSALIYCIFYFIFTNNNKNSLHISDFIERKKLRKFALER